MRWPAGEVWTYLTDELLAASRYRQCGQVLASVGVGDSELASCWEKFLLVCAEKGKCWEALRALKELMGNTKSDIAMMLGKLVNFLFDSVVLKEYLR